MFKIFLNTDNIKQTNIHSDISYLSNPDFLCIVGSKLYGTNTEDSDCDIRGFTFPTPEYLLGIKRWELYESTYKTEKQDLVIWSVDKFFRMLLNGSTIAFEMLSCRESFIIRQSELAKEIVKWRKCFVSEKIIKSILGYAMSEWRMTLGEITRDLGEQRKEHIKQVGYSYKYAYHAIRILQEGMDLANQFYISFPCQNAEFLKAVKIGKVSFKDAEDTYKYRLNQLEERLHSGTIAKELDFDFLNTLLCRLNLKNIFSNLISTNIFDKELFTL